MANPDSLEFAALDEEDIMDGEGELGGMEESGNSALDILGQADEAIDDIQAKMELE